ncbi:MAG: hypothetical protein IKU42_07415 [Oscillospiraceae bacterium]|nr:hypothetical protein [Oscillospiraceae bacterium]
MRFDEMPCFFLGANAPKGYYSRFDQLFSSAPEGKCYLLKGGPGTGKSTVLKKTAEILGRENLSTELIYCSADINSLDAIIADEGKFVMADATLPHSVEPKYPGIYETTVSLCDCWDEEKLREHRKKAAALFDENRRLHEQGRRYISAAASLLDEAQKLGNLALNQEKTARAALRICLREFGRKQHKSGTEKIRFLSAVSEKGVFFFDKTAKILCDKIYVIDDDCGAAAKIFMSTVRKTALEHGLDIISCRCSIFPAEKTEHIFIPNLRLGFMTKNRRHNFEILPFRTIHAKRFYDEKIYSRHKARMKFALRCASAIIAKASECMAEAKKVHDELEKIYIDAMDFSKVDSITEKIFAGI